MSRRGENIYKRKDGRWEGRFVDSYDQFGKPKYHSIYARSYTEVKDKLVMIGLKLSNSSIRNPHIVNIEIFVEITLYLSWADMMHR